MKSVIPMILAALVAAGAASAQGDGSPIDLPELREAVVEVYEIDYPKTLPTGRVATVDGEVLTQADLLKQLLGGNLGQISNTLLMTKMCEIELEREGLAVGQDEALDELEEMMPRLAPGRTIDELVAMGVYSRSYLMNIARMNRGWKKLFWKSRNIPEEKRSDQANQLLMQLYLNEVKGRYQLAVRGKEPAPPRGAVAALNTIVGGKRVSYVVSAEEAIEFLVGLLRPSSISQGMDRLIENHLVRREMERAGVRVADSEVEAWANEMVERYPPPFTWETILRIKGTTPDAEKERWRNVQAWKRATGTSIEAADLDAFRKEHEDFFRSRHTKVSHVLLQTVDPITGLSRGPEAEAEALERARTIQRLAREGVDFAKLAKLYSDDSQTKDGGGRIQQPIKKWGGGYDPSFQDVAYGLEKGELSEPVKSQFGYHVVLCDEVSPPSMKDINWNESRYAEWILEEYESAEMRAWLDSLIEAATIDRISDEALYEIKKMEFPEKEPRQ